MTPEEMSTGEQTQGAERALDGRAQSLITALVVLLAGVVGLPQLLESVRAGDVELGTVFYPVVLVAFAWLAWTKRGRA